MCACRLVPYVDLRDALTHVDTPPIKSTGLRWGWRMRSHSADMGYNRAKAYMTFCKPKVIPDMFYLKVGNSNGVANFLIPDWEPHLQDRSWQSAAWPLLDKHLRGARNGHSADPI